MSMEILLERIQLDPEFTIGRLSIGGKFECYTCEDTVRAPGVKVYGKTAIPYGRYQVVVTMSNRFGMLMPLLVKVPMFEGIRIHPGNTQKDTDGCILPGRVRNPDGVGQSRLAYDQLFGKIKQFTMRMDMVWITIAQGETND